MVAKYLVKAGACQRGLRFGISNCRTGMVVKATAAVTAAAMESCDHHSKAAATAVTTTDK